MSDAEITDLQSGPTTHPTGGAGTGPKRESDDDEAYSPDEVAARLRVGYRTVMRSIHLGEIGAFKIGRYYRIPKAELRRVLDEAVTDSAA